MGIRENIQEVREKVAEAANRAGRDPGAVKLVAVTKTVPVDKVMEAYNCGLRDFGESRAQELLQKCGHLPPDANWHFIGTLQTNKVKKIIGRAGLIHSLDRIALAEEIDRAARETGQVARVLLQVNIGSEETKHGLPPGQLVSFAARVAGLPGLPVCGLMAIAPRCGEPGEMKPFFREMKALFDQVKESVPGLFMRHLSMGMTGDYQVAVEEGATILRVGTAIFGAR